MKKFLLSLVLSTFIFQLSSLSASADRVCQPIYGGGESCLQVGPLAINKMVSHPQTGSFVENVINDAKFAPDQPISFQITVINTGQTSLSKVTVRDILPVQVVFVSGPGSFDGNNRTIAFDLINMAPNESRTQTITAKVVPGGQLGEGTICPVNQATATFEGQTSADNAQFCIVKPVAGVAVTPLPGKGAPAVPPVTKGGLKVFPPPKVVETPPTGPEALGLLALIPTGALGAYLKKKASQL